MTSYKLDWKKLDQFRQDKKALDWRELGTKYRTIYGYRPSFLPHLFYGDHMIYTLVAHSRGHIHARKMVRDTCWEEPNELHHSWKALSRTFKIEIRDLEEQAMFLGPWLEFFRAIPDPQVQPSSHAA